MNQCLRLLPCIAAFAALAFIPTELAAKSRHTSSASKKTHEAKAGKQRHAAAKSHRGKHADAKSRSQMEDDAPSDKPAAPPLTGDLAALK
ncbi:MAG: lytic transglycosylase domain-containing protein, partial [Bradyrhizobium sp.]